ncbi:elongation factor P [Thermomicrobiaceae bacterium CFH 74404]|uniref:Elongation factor P n=2 Tax=Thermomicrobia TaxID=189775 RepID=A0AA41WDC6_9BACT|nr:elongation factor P [Thermalbibacter longus]MCM8747988.1 elongation factor P [Thermalbibacter longus]
MIETGDLRKGLTLQIDGDLVRVLDFQHVKQGRGSAFVRLTLRNLRTGATTTTTVQAGSRFQVAPLERHRVQFLYEEEGQYHFMDLESFEQFALDREALGDAVNYLKENMTLDLLTYEGQAVEVELPVTVDLRVVETDPGVRGDTATGGTKPARLETGLVVNVPLFVSIDDVVKVDTRTGEYIERVS